MFDPEKSEKTGNYQFDYRIELMRQSADLKKPVEKRLKRHYSITHNEYGFFYPASSYPLKSTSCNITVAPDVAADHLPASADYLLCDRPATL